MIAFRRQILLEALKVLDLLGMVFWFCVATSAVSYRTDTLSLIEFLSMRIKVQNFLVFLGFLLVWYLVFSLFDLYHARRLSTAWYEFIDALKATSLGTLAIAIAAIVFSIEMVTPVFLSIFWVGNNVTVISVRLLFKVLVWRIRMDGRNIRHVLIIGTNPRAVRFARKIEAEPELGYRVIGFADEEWAGNEEFDRTGFVRVGDFREVAVLLRESVIDEVVITLPIKSFYTEIVQVLSHCEEQGIMVRFLSEIFDLKLAKTWNENFEEYSVMTLHNGIAENWSLLTKRAFDFSLSLIAITLLSPVLIGTALLVKITSPGPVFYIQERVGLNKRRFRMYKFRTMIPDAERKLAEFEHLNEVSGPVFKIKDDPRITPIGRILRRTSLDELPQLFNVLKGDMSLVGPRPLPVRDYDGFREDWQRRRFSVRPGITCLWQIDGRSSIPFEKWMQLDMQYIDEWSLWLDLKILARTIPAVVKGSGAA
jgi:exopolysaccharide biosynthesis polyprenyl glycosylphosphotransferase